jgi:hypothetical protein
MAIKKKRALLSALLFLFFSSMVFAQTGETGADQFTLFWRADEYAWNYEVTLEKLGPEGFTEILRERTEEAEVICSLTTGRYRYQVTAYDFFGNAGGISAWSYFELIPGQVEIIIEEPEPVVEEPVVEEPEPPIQPEILVEEPEPPVEAPKEPGDFFVEAAYSPLISLPNTEFNRLFKGLLPGGASARLGFIPFKGRLFSLGFELDPSWSYLSSHEDNYSVYAQLLDLHLGLVGLLWLPNGTMAVDFRLGAGLSLLYNFHFEYEGQQNKDQLNTWIPSMRGGISFVWMIRNPFFLEIGVELLHVFSVDNIPLEFIRPSLGVGLRF